MSGEVNAPNESAHRTADSFRLGWLVPHLDSLECDWGADGKVFVARLDWASEPVSNNMSFHSGIVGFTRLKRFALGTIPQI